LQFLLSLAVGPSPGNEAIGASWPVELPVLRLRIQTEWSGGTAIIYRAVPLGSTSSAALSLLPSQHCSLAEPFFH
jgi:hypothetical protein